MEERFTTVTRMEHTPRVTHVLMNIALHLKHMYIEKLKRMVLAVLDYFVKANSL